MPIRQLRNGRWKIDNVPGTHETKEDAEEQLQAIKADQRRRKEGKKK